MKGWYKNIKKRNSKGVSINININKKQRDEFLTDAVKGIKPCEKTMEDLEKYIIEKYNATPYKLSVDKIKALKVNVILNYFKEVLNEAEESKFDLEKDDLIKQAKKYPAEKLGLDFRGYKLTGNEGDGDKNIIIEMERKSKYFSIENGNNDLLNDLIIYLGVSKKDIDKKSSRFIQYVYSLKEVERI
ncbi:hypothetical protein [Dethiothermospora halolimnae]|uniref:hypothetical protein n=1 Tax=Dethiothermospora halolimnae TaxID=3114390 RepID=UPI003CCC0CC2